MRFVILFTLVSLSTSPMILAQGVGVDSASQQPSRDFSLTHGSTHLGGSCVLVDFEGYQSREPIGRIEGLIDITFGTAWHAGVDSDAGGTVNVANEPSGDTIAFYLSNDPAPINFGKPVQYVSLFYSAAEDSVPMTLVGWDRKRGRGNIVATATGNTIGVSRHGAPCQGDPTGEFCLWDTVTLVAPSSSIQSITFVGTQANLIAFDDLIVCEELLCGGPSDVNVQPDRRGLNVAQSISAFPEGNVPRVGNGTFAIDIDSPNGDCGIAPDTPVFLIVSASADSVTMPNAGCQGDGELMVAPRHGFMRFGGLWSGPGSPVRFDLPIPFDPSLCGQAFFAQGIWADGSLGVLDLSLTWRLDCVVGF